MYIHMTLRAIAPPIRMFLDVVLLRVLNVDRSFACSLLIFSVSNTRRSIVTIVETATDSRVVAYEHPFLVLLLLRLVHVLASATELHQVKSPKDAHICPHKLET